MNAQKVFCEECRSDVDYVVTTVPMTGTIKDKEYSFTGKEARCTNCDSLIYVPELSDTNLQALYDVYRQENGIIPLSQIQEIPKKYNIGKRPLSLLLGWGEQTFSRYYDGDMPTKQYSDILVRIYRKPLFFSKLLEANKGNLKSAEPVRGCYSSRSAKSALLYSGILFCLLSEIPFQRRLSGMGSRPGL